MFLRLPARIAIFAGLASAMFPAMLHAQVNIDQGKSPAEIYGSDCATCHKTPRGLAVGKNSLTLSAFLREHYTASRDQAAALAAYVLSIGGAEPAPRQKPELEHARAEEPKSAEPRTSEPKPGEPKTATRAVRAGTKPDEKRPKEQEAKGEEPSAPAAQEKREAPEAASREEKQEPVEAAPAAREPARVAATPPPNETPGAQTPSPAASSSASAQAISPARRESGALPSLELGSSLAAVPPPADAQSSAAVPRDNIPD